MHLASCVCVTDAPSKCARGSRIQRRAASLWLAVATSLFFPDSPVRAETPGNAPPQLQPNEPHWLVEFIAVDIGFAWAWAPGDYAVAHAPERQVQDHFRSAIAYGLRLLTFRAGRGRFTPLSIFAKPGDDRDGLDFFLLGCEGAWHRRGWLGSHDALQLALGGGLGGTTVHVPGECDGVCQAGGAGLVLSPRVHYYPVTIAGWGVGLWIRALVPAVTVLESVGWGTSFHAGISFAFIPDG